MSETIDETEIIDETDPVAPELDDIFARLRESASQPQAASQPEETESAEPDPGGQPGQDESSKKPAKSSKKRSARKKASKKSAQRTSAQEISAERPSDEILGADTAANAEVAEAAEAVSPETDDINAQTAQIEDLKRQIRRTLTTDESKVLQAIHRLHNKAPKKAEELQTVLSSQDIRTAEFAELLPVPSDRIQSLLAAPLSSSLADCDITESDTKTLVQQVRNVYRSFAQQQIAPVAAALAKHVEAEETAK